MIPRSTGPAGPAGIPRPAALYGTLAVTHDHPPRVEQSRRAWPCRSLCRRPRPRTGLPSRSDRSVCRKAQGRPVPPPPPRPPAADAPPDRGAPGWRARLGALRRRALPPAPRRTRSIRPLVVLRDRPVLEDTDHAARRPGLDDVVDADRPADELHLRLCRRHSRGFIRLVFSLAVMFHSSFGAAYL